MRITRFQSDALRSLAANRSPDSYIAAGVAINREGPRYSADIDISTIPRPDSIRGFPDKHWQDEGDLFLLIWHENEEKIRR